MLPELNDEVGVWESCKSEFQLLANSAVPLSTILTTNRSLQEVTES